MEGFGCMLGVCGLLGMIFCDCGVWHTFLGFYVFGIERLFSSIGFVELGCDGGFKLVTF